jgi:hypothetical protein
MNEQLRLQAIQNVAQAVNGLQQTVAPAIARVLSVVVVPFSGLPAPAIEGMFAGVNDSNTATWGATIAGGGSNHVLAYFNGTVWTVSAK